MAGEAETIELPDELSSARRSSAAGGDAAIMGGMADVKSRELDEKTRVFGDTERRMEEDRSFMKDRMDAAGLEVEKLRPWNHDEEAARRTADPLETFGSLGSVFGILASAFTRAPMEHALNASAAAMNAVKAANEEDYKKAYTSWKDNMTLVEKRHNMIQAQFRDAQALFQTDMAAGVVKAQNIATRYGDAQSLFLLENGMNKEFFELQTQRATAMEKMSEATRKITENTFRQKVFENIVKELPPEKQNDPMSVMRAWNYSHGMSSKTEEDVMMRWWSEHPDATAEEAANFAAKYKRDQSGNQFMTADRLDAAEIDRRSKQYIGEGMAPNEAYDKAAREVRKVATESKISADQEFIRRFHEENPNATTDEFSKAFAKFKSEQKPAGAAGGGNTELTGPRQIAASVANRKKEWAAEKNQDGEPKYTSAQVDEMGTKELSRLTALAASPTANQRDQLRSMIDRTVNFEQTIDKVEGLLAKHNALTGIGGRVTRPAEVIGNVFGSNDTDRSQFTRWHAELKEWAARILNESRGRPLAAEAAQVDRIVAGMSLGDTTANTVRAYRELRPLIQQIREQLVKREGGTWEPPKSSGAPLPASDKWWQKDKRTDLGVNDNVAQRGNTSDETETGREVIDVPPGRNPLDFIPRRRVG